MCFGIVHPEMVALGAWIGDARAAHLLYLFQEFRASQDRRRNSSQSLRLPRAITSSMAARLNS